MLACVNLEHEGVDNITIPLQPSSDWSNSSFPATMPMDYGLWTMDYDSGMPLETPKRNEPNNIHIRSVPRKAKANRKQLQGNLYLA